MQAYFGRVLAGEIKQPRSFSIKTLKLLGDFDQRSAHLFRKFCSLCVVLRFGGNMSDARVPSLDGNAATNATCVVWTRLRRAQFTE